MTFPESDAIDAGTIDVEQLADPVPPPWAADGLAPDEADDEPEPAPPPAAVAAMLEPVLGVPFYAAGVALGRGLDTRRRRQVRALWWSVGRDGGLAPVAAALAPLVPAAWLASRAASLSPGVAAVAMLGALVTDLLEQTNAIREGATPDGRTADNPGTPSPAPQPAGDDGRRPPRRRRAAAGQPADVAAPVRADGFEGGGLGLGESV